MALNRSEVKRLEKAKAWWRPIAGFTASFCAATITLTVCVVVLKDHTQLSTAISFFTAAIPSLAVFLTGQGIGRSWEKTSDSANYAMDDIEPIEAPPTVEDFIEGQR